MWCIKETNLCYILDAKLKINLHQVLHADVMSSNSPYPTFISSDASAVTNDAAKQQTDTPVPPSSEDQQNQSNADKAKSRSEAEQEADRMYEERIEEEYAKREGGA
jgi:hypothetical protein